MRKCGEIYQIIRGWNISSGARLGEQGVFSQRGEGSRVTLEPLAVTTGVPREGFWTRAWNDKTTGSSFTSERGQG